MPGVSSFSVAGVLRRARRSADLSQREMAAAAGIAKSTLAAAEAGTRDLPMEALARVAAAAGLRLALVDPDGVELAPMDDGAVRDRGGRRFPAHLDTRHSGNRWWHGSERYSRRQPWYTFDQSRETRDAFRQRDGTPADHQVPLPGDSPADRRAAPRRAVRRRLQEARQRDGAARLEPDWCHWVCECPPGCGELEDWQGLPKHVEECPCGCDPC